jgi:hypothetical protein
MAIELYILDALPVSERFAVEAKRMRALGKEFPGNLGIGDPLEERIKGSNGYSSSFEMRTALEKMGIPYDANSSTHYNYKILVPDDKLDIVKDLVQKSGYSILTRPPEHNLMPAK